jgi:peptidoglycan/LPS O-acetylase OafA/YrhL
MYPYIYVEPFLSSNMVNEQLKNSSSILKYNPQFDGLRFIAVFFVVCYHWLPSFHHSVAAEFLGGGKWINFFFVLSSYLITRILISARAKGEQLDISRPKVIGVFLLRRTVRIFPPYYLYLLALLLIPNITTEVKEHSGWYFSYLSNYRLFETQEYNRVTAHLWTLAVEEQFYIFWPFVILFVPQRHLLKTFLFIIGASVATRIAFYHPVVISQQILTEYCADAFAIGGIMAYKYTLATEKEKLLITKWIRIALYSSIVLSIPILITKSDYFGFIFNRLFFSIISFAIIEGALKGYNNWFGRFLVNKRVLYIGRISYGIYLYHLLVPVIFWRLYRGLSHYFEDKHAIFLAKFKMPIDWFEITITTEIGSFVIYCICVIIIASLSARFIEKPLSKLKVGYTGSSKSTAEQKQEPETK